MGDTRGRRFWNAALLGWVDAVTIFLSALLAATGLLGNAWAIVEVDNPGITSATPITRSTVTASQCLRTNSTGSDFLAGPGCGNPRGGATVRKGFEVVDGGTATFNYAGVSSMTFTRSFTGATGATVTFRSLLQGSSSTWTDNATWSLSAASITLTTTDDTQPTYRLCRNNLTNCWIMGVDANGDFTLHDVTNDRNVMRAADGTTPNLHLQTETEANRGGVGFGRAAADSPRALIHASSGTGNNLRTVLIDGNSPVALQQGPSSFTATSDSWRLGLPLTMAASSVTVLGADVQIATGTLRVTGNNAVGLIVNNQVTLSSSTAATVSSCGTGPAILGSDAAGRVTVGSAPGTSCTVTFATAYANVPICVTANETTANLTRPAPTTTTLVINGTLLASDTLAYICFGRQ